MSRNSYAVLMLAGFAVPASAQTVLPVLEVDFTSAVVPLSPLLPVIVAIGIAAIAARVLRRVRPGARLLAWGALAVAVLPLVHALGHAPLISSALATPVPPVPLALTTSPTIVTGFGYFDYIKTTNESGVPITIVAVKYDTGSTDYYIDTVNTTCVPGLALAPGAFCFIRILSLG